MIFKNYAHRIHELAAHSRTDGTQIPALHPEKLNLLGQIRSWFGMTHTTVIIPIEPSLNAKGI
jgi:hypothetical protein